MVEDATSFNSMYFLSLLAVLELHGQRVIHKSDTTWFLRNFGLAGDLFSNKKQNLEKAEQTNESGTS